MTSESVYAALIGAAFLGASLGGFKGMAIAVVLTLTMMLAHDKANRDYETYFKRKRK